MKKIKNEALKVVVGALLLTGVFTGVYTAINHVAFEVLAGENVEEIEGGLPEVEPSEYPTEDQGPLLTVINEETDANEEANAREYFEVIIPDLQDATITVFLDDGRQRLSTEEIVEIVARMIYEKYGFVIDGTTIDMVVSRYTFHYANWVIEMPGEVMNDSGALFRFNVNTITGDIYSLRPSRLMAHELSLFPTQEISLNNMNFTVANSSNWPDIRSAHHDFASYYSHLSIERVAEIMAEAIYEQYGESIDGTILEVFNFGDDIWHGSVFDPNGSFVNDELFVLSIDVRTGDVWGVMTRVEMDARMEETGADSHWGWGH